MKKFFFVVELLSLVWEVIEPLSGGKTNKNTVFVYFSVGSTKSYSKNSFGVINYLKWSENGIERESLH